MAKHSSKLYKHRSTTQEFLFSHSDDIVEDSDAQYALTDRESDETALTETHFSDVLDRKGLRHAIDTQMDSAASLFAIAVRMEWAPTEQSNAKRGLDLPQDALKPMATICHSHSGTWARIGHDRWVCVFGGTCAADGHLLAQAILAAYAEKKGPLITIGTATYPTVNFTRNQIVENAEKALDHAGFFGPGTITGFDAVSLNISGDRHYQAGDISGAIDEYKKGLLLDPADANLHNSLGVCYGILKEYDYALAAFENAIWLDPNDAMALYNKGYVLLLKGALEQAMECFLEADTREPNLFEVVFHIGQTFMIMNQAEKARPYLEAATRVNSRSDSAFKALGECLDALGLTKEATQAYKAAVKINPTDAESLSMLGGLYTKRKESLDVALVLCEQSVQLAPDNGLFRHRLGLVYLNQVKLEKALAEFELAMTLDYDSQSQIEAIQDRMTAAKAS